MIPQQEYGSTRIHQKMLLFMVATGDDSIQHQPVPNSSSFHENTSRIHLKIQKNQKKIQKRPFVRTKNEWLAIPRGPQFKGPSHLFGSANTRTLQAKRPRRGLVICCPFGLAMEDHHHVSPMFVAELSLFLLIKTCSVDGKSFLDDKKLMS